MADQFHFEFNDWERAFSLFYRRKERDETLVFIISTAPDVSGYWIESGPAESDKHTKVYGDAESVKNLERRVRQTRNSRTSLALGKVVT